MIVGWVFVGVVFGGRAERLPCRALRIVVVVAVAFAGAFATLGLASKRTDADAISADVLSVTTRSRDEVRDLSVAIGSASVYVLDAGARPSRDVTRAIGNASADVVKSCAPR
jgi:hypothetical protein